MYLVWCVVKVRLCFEELVWNSIGVCCGEGLVRW